MTEPIQEVLQAAVDLFVSAILNIIQRDPHQWSTRPCQSCRTISSLINRPFGCILYRMQKEKEKKEKEKKKKEEL